MLIDRAFALLAEHQDRSSLPQLTTDPTGTAAQIAYCARLAGYPDMSSVVGRVLATRTVRVPPSGTPTV